MNNDWFLAVFFGSLSAVAGGGASRSAPTVTGVTTQPPKAEIYAADPAWSQW